MHVGIVEAGDDRPALAVNDLGRRTALPQNLVACSYGGDLIPLDSDRFDKRRNTVRRNLRVVEDGVGRHGALLSCATRTVGGQGCPAPQGVTLPQPRGWG